MSKSPLAPLSRFIRLPRREQAALVQAVALLAAIRVGLRLFRFATVRDLLGVVSRFPRRQRDTPEAIRRRVIWAVEAAGRRFPRIGTCLTHAMAAHALLARHGQQSNLRIGVRLDARGAFDAHAWLEQDGAILTGDDARASFTPMPALTGLNPPRPPERPCAS